MDIRHVAITAHVDHGKTTFVNRLQQQTASDSRTVFGERALDSHDLERERGITIPFKTTTVEHAGCRIDLTVSPLREKKLTNIRAAGSDENILPTPPVELSLEQTPAFTNEDELVEVTPRSIRIRRKWLRENQRPRAG